MKIGVLSDTHIPKRAKNIPEVVFNAFIGVDFIIHAGDLSSLEVLNQLEAIAPVYAVAGNVDSIELHLQLGNKKILTFEKFKIGLFHGHGLRGNTLNRVIHCFKGDEVNCIIFGHSHQPYCQYHGDRLLFNPGSPTDKRKNEYYSFGILDINHSIDAKIYFFNSAGVIIKYFSLLDKIYPFDKQ